MEDIGTSLINTNTREGCDSSLISMMCMMAGAVVGYGALELGKLNKSRIVNVSGYAELCRFAICAAAGVDGSVDDDGIREGLNG